MAAKSERVMQMVKREVEKNPSVPSRELFERAKAMDPAVSGLTLQQFHAGYPLQVKRRLKLSASRDAGASTPPTRQRPPRPPQARATAAAKAGPIPRRHRRTRATTPGEGPTPASGRGGRDTVRQVLIQFAGEIAAVDQKADVVRVIGRMDRYVDQVMRATGA